MMLTRFFRSIAFLALVAGIAVAATPTTARAVVVDFSTSGTFSGPNAVGNVLSAGGITITFNGRTGGIPVGTPSNTSFGDFVVTGVANSTATYTNNFTLTINQTVPSAGNANFPAATVNGTITIDTNNVGTSDAYVQFASPLNQTIGSIISYKIQNADDLTPGKISLPANGMATINGQVTAVPEPATLLSLAVGLPLLGLGAWMRRRRQSS